MDGMPCRNPVGAVLGSALRPDERVQPRDGLLRATEMFRAFIRRHAIPNASQLAQKSARMSAEALVKLYLE